MFIHGISGVGKTRFSLMLLELLKEYISRQRFNNDADVVALRNALSKSRTVLLDIQHNGNSISELEVRSFLIRFKDYFAIHVLVIGI